MRRLVLILVAVAFTALGTQASTKADAASAQFPRCISTVIDSHTTRYWLDVGDLYSNVRSVQLSGEELNRRRDGVWVITTDPAPRRERPWVYFTYNHSSDRGAWVACRKPSPR